MGEKPKHWPKTMGEKPKPWPKLEPMSNARLRRRPQPSLERTAARPVPIFIPGQLSLFWELWDEAGESVLVYAEPV